MSILEILQETPNSVIVGKKSIAIVESELTTEFDATILQNDDQIGLWTKIGTLKRSYNGFQIEHMAFCQQNNAIVIKFPDRKLCASVPDGFKPVFSERRLGGWDVEKSVYILSQMGVEKKKIKIDDLQKKSKEKKVCKAMKPEVEKVYKTLFGSTVTIPDNLTPETKSVVKSYLAREIFLKYNEV